MIQFNYDKQANILISLAKDEVGLAQIKEHYLYIRDNARLPRRLNVMIDGRLSRFKIDINDLEQMRAFVKDCISGYANVREAFVVDKPYETTIALLFEEAVQLPNYHFRIFSTEEAALYWLSLYA